MDIKKVVAVLILAAFIELGVTFWIVTTENERTSEHIKEKVREQLQWLEEEKKKNKITPPMQDNLLHFYDKKEYDAYATIETIEGVKCFVIRSIKNNGILNFSSNGNPDKIKLAPQEIPLYYNNQKTYDAYAIIVPIGVNKTECLIIKDIETENTLAFYLLNNRR